MKFKQLYDADLKSNESPHHELANDAEERAIVTASMNAIGQAMSAWTQLLQHPAVESPSFRKGFISNLVTTVAQLGVVAVIAVLTRYDRRHTW